MLMLKIAFRNIFRQKRRTLFTALSMFIGFFLSSLFIAWEDGSYNDIINMFTRNRLGHIQIHEKDYLEHPSQYKTINNQPEIDHILKQTEEIEHWAPRLYSAGLVSVGEKTAGVQIIGIDPERETRMTRFDKKIKQGHNFSRYPSKEAVIGKSLAEILKAELNDEIIIVSQAADGSIANDLYTIIGITESGDDITDRISFYLHLKDAQELMVLEGRIHEIAITVQDLNSVFKTNKILENKINNPELSVDPWQEFAKSFYMAMQADKQGTYIMLLIIILIAAVGVLNTVLMSVLERQREYGVIKAVGTKPSQIVKLVLFEVAILAFICVIIGAGVGFLANTYLSHHGIALSTPLSYGGMKFQYLKSEINARSFYIPALTIMISAMLVGLFPALKAAHTDPAKSMRIH